MTEKTLNGCGCFVVFVIIASVLGFNFIVSAIYIKQNNAPMSCMFAVDTVTCVQVAKEK